MKTKLLKKIRRKYEIKRFDYIDDPNHRFFKVKTPFWILYTYGECDSAADVGYSYDEIYYRLKYVIHREYYPLMKREKNKIEKVWYNG